MRNVFVNYGESIFEPFWDCGESYPNHNKFSPLTHYNTVARNKTAKAEETWCGIRVSVMNTSMEEYDFVMETECDIDVSQFDEFRLFAVIPESMCLTAKLIIDGKEIRITHNGINEAYEYMGKINGKKLTMYSLSFKALKDNVSVLLSYAGLADTKRVKFMEGIKSPYDEQWEGCFSENYKISPKIGLYFDENGLIRLREKIKREPFSSIMQKIRLRAEENMKIRPEENISTYIMRPDKRWVSMRDRKREAYNEIMEQLAFVGIVDENYDMLRLACRMALSAAHCNYWCESVMGVFPGATWHHRSFTEWRYLKSCAIVLDWAGGLLTWHGKHIITDAMIMKGLPRLEADFMTVDYIRHMNQGIVFSGGRIPALIALSKDYPRYVKRLEEAENDLFEMIEDYFEEDGGVAEGPAYWNYTLFNILPIIYIIAKRRNKDIWEILPQKVKKSLSFGLCMMSDVNDGRYMLPINDAHTDVYNPIISSVFSQHNESWKKIYFKTLEGEFEADKEFLIMAETAEGKSNGEILGKGLIAHTITGQVSFRREFCGGGQLHLHLVSGKTYFAHTHGDKGSFILELDHIPIFIDRGVAPYSAAYTEIADTQMHNCFAPFAENKILNQPKFDVFGGRVTKCYENGSEFIYETDLREAWEKGRFTELKRKIVLSENELIITDMMRSEKMQKMYFCLNTRGEVLIKDSYAEILTQQHKVTIFYDNNNCAGVEAKQLGMDENLTAVNRFAVFYKESNNLTVTTKINFERR